MTSSPPRRPQAAHHPPPVGGPGAGSADQPTPEPMSEPFKGVIVGLALCLPFWALVLGLATGCGLVPRIGGW
jgi:hypothetical protein